MKYQAEWMVKGFKLFRLNSECDIKYQNKKEYKRMLLKTEGLVVYIPKIEKTLYVRKNLITN